MAMKRGSRSPFKRRALAAWCAGLAVVSGFGSGAAQPADAAGSIAKLDTAFALMERAVAKNEVTGVVVLVARQGRILREAAYGFADVEQRVPMTTDTICWIASITKPITATAVMKLVETGKLALDDPIERYLPEFGRPKDASGRPHTITVRHLLTHTSGIVASPPGRKDVFTDGWRTKTLAETVAPIGQATLLFPPGTRVEYSNAAFYVLGRLIEVVSGKSYGDYLKAEILAPLGMEDSHLPRFLAGARKPVAVVYRGKKAAWRLFFRYDPSMEFRNDTSDGGVFCTAGDLFKFFQMFMDNDGRVLSATSIEQMLAEQADGRGLGWSLREGGFSHGGSSGAFAWADPPTGVVGVLMIQSNDFDRTLRLHSQFVEAVRTAFGDATAAATRIVRQYEPRDFRFTSLKEYSNAFQDVQIWANLTGPSGQALKVLGFHDGGTDFVARLRFDAPGIWRIRTGASPDDPDLESGFSVEVGETSGRGPVRIAHSGVTKSATTGQPGQSARFTYGDGSPFFHAGDTCYPLLVLERETQLLPYLDRRKKQGFSHIRFQCARGKDVGSPWAGTPENLDLDRYNLAFFAHFDQVMRDLRERGLAAEPILLSYYATDGPMANPGEWSREREEAWLRYLVARYGAFDNVLYWTLANEFETHPDGKYRIDAEDSEWARRTAALVKSLDAYQHPVTVHPFMSCGEYLANFGRAPEIDLLMFQEHGRETPIEKSVADGEGEGIEDKVLVARTLGKPVVVGEYGYEWDGTTLRGVNSTTDLLRRHTWRIAMAGGHFSAGFRSTVFNFPGIVFDPTNGGRPGADQVATLIRFFRQRTKFQYLEPAFHLVSDPNLCLVGKEERVVYAPQGGEIDLDLSAETGSFRATWLNPISGEMREAGVVAGHARVTLVAPWPEAVLYLRADTPG